MEAPIIWRDRLKEELEKNWKDAHRQRGSNCKHGSFERHDWHPCRN